MTAPDPREEAALGLLALLLGIDAKADDLAARRTADREDTDRG